MRACNPKDVQYVSSRCCYSVCFDSNSHLSSFEVVSSIARIFALLLKLFEEKTCCYKRSFSFARGHAVSANHNEHQTGPE